jgi:hypothetical protein
MGKLLVTLDTLAPDRDFINIDGVKCELRNADELSLEALAQIMKLAKDVEARSGTVDEPTIEDMEIAARFASETLDLIMVDLPADVKARLRNDQKIKIIVAFTSVVAPKSRARAATENLGALPTTDVSSHVSRDSMEEHD